MSLSTVQVSHYNTLSACSLFHSPGQIKEGDIESMAPNHFDDLHWLNLRAPFMLTRFFKDLLIEAKGCIVNVSCEKGSRPDPMSLGYCMVKAGLEMLTKSTAIEFAYHDVRVNAVAPGFCDTNLYSSHAGSSEYTKIKQLASTNVPLKRLK